MTATGRRSPVQALPRVERPPVRRDDTWSAATSAWITGEEPVFAGHYPDFPIFPGVCVVDCVIGGALATSPPDAGELVLDTVESARFVGAVYPGDRLDVDLEWSRIGDGAWRCAATAATDRGNAASVRLTFGQAP